MKVSTPVRLTLRETVQKLILDEVIDGSAPTSTWKIMIMDEGTTRSVSSCLTMFEIMEHNVSLVENLKAVRQPFKDMDAVYFISPKKSSAKRVMLDFISQERAKEIQRDEGTNCIAVQRYGKVHLVFTGSIDQDIVNMIQTNDALMNRVKTFKEVHFDFLVPESWIYQFDMADAFTNIFTQLLNADEYTTLIGKKLATLCISINEYPNIRCQASSSTAKAIANVVNAQLQAYKRNNSNFLPYGEDSSSDRDRGILIILDRMFDPLTPLMHEYTYQAMANDLLEVDSNGLIHFETTTERGDKVAKEAILNSEADDLWVEHRHKHIAKVIASLKERMDDILQTNAGSKLAKKNTGVDMDMSTMASAVKNLPQYQQLMTDLGRHVAITSMCMREFNNQNLINLAAVEQTLSTGVDEDGKEVKGKKVTEMMVTFFNSNPGMTRELKTRLLLVYFVTQRPISADDRRQVTGAARLSNLDQQVLFNMSQLLDNNSHDAQHASLAAGANSVNNPTAMKSGGGFFSSLFGRGREAEKIAATVEGSYIDTRHVSTLKILIEQTINGVLPSDRYLSIGPAVAVNNETKVIAPSARKFKGNDRWGGNASSELKNKILVGGRVIAFIAGGISYAEMRDGYEIMGKEGKEVMLGGTHLITPSQYIRDILKINPPK